MSSKAVLVTGTAVVVIAGTAALAAPGCVHQFQHRHEQESTYATGHDAKAARASVPRWLPDRATSIQYRMSTTGGDRILKATLPDGRLPHGCESAVSTTPARARLKASWFPPGTDTRPSAICGGTYNAVLDGKSLYAWQDDAAWAKAHATPHAT